MKRVFQNDYRKFQFTTGQLKLLRDCLDNAKIRTKKNDVDVHSDFLNLTSEWVGVWLEILKAEIYYDEKEDVFELLNYQLPPRKKKFGRPMEPVTQSFSRLKHVIESLPPYARSVLQMRVTVDLYNSPSYLKHTVLSYRYFDDDPLTPKDTPTLLLFHLLTLFDKASREIESEYKDGGGSHSPILKFLIRELAVNYGETYRKRPAYSPNTIFVRYIETIADIFSLKVSTDLIKPIVQESIELTDALNNMPPLDNYTEVAH